MCEEKQLHSTKIFMKVLPKSLEKNGIKYVEGFITDKVPFNPQQCMTGGIHYCQEEDIMSWMWLGEYVADVTVPQDAQVVCYGNKYKASAIVLSNIRHISDYMNKKYPMNGDKYHPVILSWLYDDYRNIRYVKQQTPMLCKKLLDTSNGSAIMFIRNPTKEYWLKALSMNGSLINQLLSEIFAQKWSYEDTYEFFQTSLNNCGYNIRYVPGHIVNDDLRTLAIKQNPNSIYCIKEPSEELCVLAVTSSYRALAHVRPTKQLCIIALTQSELAIDLIPVSLRQDKDIGQLIKKYQLKLK